MLKNGDFEEGPFIFSDTPWGALVPPMEEDKVSPLPGWMVMSDTKVVKYVDAAHHAVPRGARAVELVAGGEAALLQEVPTTPGRWYRLSFSVGDAGNGCAQALAVRASAASSSRVVAHESRGTGGSRRGELEFAAAAGVTRSPTGRSAGRSWTTSPSSACAGARRAGCSCSSVRRVPRGNFGPAFA